VNLVPDPGLETDPLATNWFTYGSGAFTWTNGVARSGQHAISVSSVAEGMCRWMTLTKAIPVTPGQVLNVSGFIKTLAVRDTARISLTIFDASGTYLGAVWDSNAVSGTSDWTQASLSARLPANTAYARVEVRLNGPGTMWADDFSVTAS
jgi:hypothetical protein